MTKKLSLEQEQQLIIDRQLGITRPELCLKYNLSLEGLKSAIRRLKAKLPIEARLKALSDAGKKSPSKNRGFFDYIQELCPGAIKASEGIETPKCFFAVFDLNQVVPERTNLNLAYSKEQEGKRFLGIFSDEWDSKKELIQAMVRWRLNKFTGKTLRASKLQIKKLDKNKDFDFFFARNHLDGHSTASFAYGLFDGDKLIQCLSIRVNHQKEVEICRLATDYDYRVHGGAAKLLKAVKTNLPPKAVLVTFSNNRLSSGSTYQGLKANLISKNQPSYYYTDGKVRVWRYRCRRINDPEILAKYPSVPHTEKGQAKGGVFAVEVFKKTTPEPVWQIEDCGHRKWAFVT